ncbi:MAG: DUF2851 family protein [Verrucomicrobiota bacterium]
MTEQKQCKVCAYPDSVYARARQGGDGVFFLHDEDSPPPEKLLQAVWQHLRLRHRTLTTLDGRTVRILHPGFLSRSGGPDFRGAVIQFAGQPPCSGDVEIDLHPGGWQAHGHDINPSFRNVILHVIWKNTSPVATKTSSPSPPRAALHGQLDSSLAELSRWLNTEPNESLPAILRGRCAAPLRQLPPEQLSALLQQAADIRFRAKAAQFSARARDVGWEQTLWEGLFRALGYQHNSWPMLHLAEHRLRWLAAEHSPLTLQARLLGIGNLLPHELTRSPAGPDLYLQQVWNQWWRDRDAFADCLVPRSLWRFHGQRPANHPQRRLALASHWLTDATLVSKIERWCPTVLPDARLAGSLQEILQTGPDEFWSWHWTLRSPRLKKPQPLLGAGRVTDIAINVILPWLWSRANEGKNSALMSAIGHRFHAWPAAEDNAVLRLARQRLLGETSPKTFTGASQQQGLLQIVRDFCDHADATCDRCRFPAVVNEFKNGRHV